MIRKIIIWVSGLVFVSGAFVACDGSDQMYEGPAYAMFADTLTVCPVQQDGTATPIYLGLTQALDHDCTLGVEIIDEGSNAVDGYHYTLDTNTVTIPAGARAAAINVRGIYDHIGVTDSLGFRLRLVAPESAEWDFYGFETKVRLQKVCPFVPENFTGYARVSSTYQFLYKPNDQERIITTSVAGEKDDTIILHDLLYDGYDVELEFDNDDVLDPRVRICDGIIGTTDEAFSAIYGDRQLRIRDYSVIPSTFSSCGNWASIFATIYVKDFGTVGSFQFVIEWISDDEANGI